MSVKSFFSEKLPKKVLSGFSSTKKAYIKTFGCQMNEHDSARMAQLLETEGYLITNKMEKADLVLVNTCSVRENPENKVYSIIGRLSILKRKNPELIIGVAGCVAQQAKLLARASPDTAVAGNDDRAFRFAEHLLCL